MVRETLPTDDPAADTVGEGKLRGIALNGSEQTAAVDHFEYERGAIRIRNCAATGNQTPSMAMEWTSKGISIRRPALKDPQGRYPEVQRDSCVEL